MDDFVFTPQGIRDLLMTYRLEASSSLSPDGYRKAAVLILFILRNERIELIFTKRTDRVQTHKGQVSFPGGMMESLDVSVEAAALREANEEIGLNPNDIVILGQLPVMHTVTGFEITPVVGWGDRPLEFSLNSEEVERVFSIPLIWLGNPSNWAERLYTRANGSQEMVIFYEPYDGEVLWGATAKMVWHLLQAIDIKRRAF